MLAFFFHARHVLLRLSLVGKIHCTLTIYDNLLTEVPVDSGNSAFHSKISSLNEVLRHCTQVRSKTRTGSMEVEGMFICKDFLGSCVPVTGMPVF
jgi:hypothetical protein